MRRQARRSGLVMGLDTHMIAGSRACPHRLGSLARPSPARHVGTPPRPCDAVGTASGRSLRLASHQPEAGEANRWAAKDQQQYEDDACQQQRPTSSSSRRRRPGRERHGRQARAAPAARRAQDPGRPHRRRVRGPEEPDPRGP